MSSVSSVLLACLLPLAIIGLAAASDSPPEAGGYCLIGQSWPGYDQDWIEPGTIGGGGQSFFVLVDPGDGCACEVGLAVSTVDIFLTLGDDHPVPMTISVSLGWTEAVPDQADPLAWLPGATICESPVRDFTFFIPKVFVGMGIALDCDCASMAAPYFLFFTVHSEMGQPGGLFTDGSGTPEAGRFLTQIDGQWVDLVTAGILSRGELVVSAFAECCEPTVGVSAESWSGIKARYR